jgi:hypothetical protein
MPPSRQLGAAVAVAACCGQRRAAAQAVAALFMTSTPHHHHQGSGWLTEPCSAAGSQAQPVCTYPGKGVLGVCALNRGASPRLLSMKRLVVRSTAAGAYGCGCIQSWQCACMLCGARDRITVGCGGCATACETKLYGWCERIHASNEPCSVCSPVIAVASRGCRQVPACAAPGGQQTTHRSRCVVGSVG